MHFIQHFFEKTVTNANWLFNSMDVTQWGLVSVVMVVLGFIAIKFR